ncbi:MAG: ribosome biogenesis GTPase Der, partial [Rhodospirillales bacterium]|nr:ribosome biogenesis GTPase Der [Rhodospirillales bacterium]
MTFTVAIVGRPNVGKSTLFNRLVGKRLAIVDDTPGVTRDRREGEGQIAHLKFRVFDTAGLEDAFDESLEARMRIQTEQALQRADVALFLIDARSGITPLDKHFAAWLRTQPTPVVVVANKCEGRGGEAGRMEAFSLGLGEPLPISAEHGEGMGDLYDALIEYDHPEDEDGDNADGDDETHALQMAIVGRPNVGKSTLINRLIGEDRMLTGPEAGITRDSISVEWTYKGRPVRMIDTAGMRRKARVIDKIEGLSVADTLRAIRFAHVVVLVLDSADMLEKQDLTIARLVIDEGRALILAVNKWDMVENREEAMRRLRDRLEKSLPQVRGIPVITLSALTGKDVGKLLPAVTKAYDVWNRRISTARINRWLESILEHHPPPLGKAKRRIKIRYMTQAKARPPTFILFVSTPEDLPESYLRYLANALRDDFDMPGVP